MLYLTLAVLSIPLLAMLWALVCIVRDRTRLRKHHFLALFGGLLMLPIGITFLGIVESGLSWITSLPGIVFGSVAMIGTAIFVRAEIEKSRQRPFPEWACQECGYDCRGIDGPCPECGKRKG